MDGSRVAQSLDSLWFYTNILTHQFDPLVLPKESQNVECHKIAEISSAVFEEVRAMPGRELTEKRERRKRRKWHKLGGNGGRNVIHGGVEVGGFLKFQEEAWKYHETFITSSKNKMPSFDDDVAMKQHLKSWAYAVACTVK